MAARPSGAPPDRTNTLLKRVHARSRAPKLRAFERRLDLGQSQLPPLQELVQSAPGAQSKWQPPPEQALRQVEPSTHCIVQPPPEQALLHVEPFSQR